MHKEYFFFNFGSILVFAVFGTLLSTIVIGIGLYVLGLLHFLDSMMYASLLSAVDPVATLAIFQALNVEPHLNALVFGESILNDAVSIVLFKSFQAFSNKPFAFYLIFEAIGHFLTIFFGSISIGVFVAIITSLVRFISFIDTRCLNTVI
jgi:NhaP-type Na+/H+ or K+/H+ antiporter